MKVVVLSFNHPGITKMCLESALHFFKRADIILVHNGSRGEFVASLREGFKDIFHLVLEENYGFSGGANRGLKTAFDSGAERVLFLSNDTKLIKWSEPPDADLVTPVIELRDTKKIYSFGARVSFVTGNLSHFTELRDESKKTSFYVPGSAFIISKKAWIKTHGFDESLGSYWEDVDLSLRARRDHLSFAVAPEIILKHGVAKTTGNNPFYTTYLFHRNQRRVVWKHGNLMSKIPFSSLYSFRVSRKLFKFLKNKDWVRFKLLLRALKD